MCWKTPNIAYEQHLRAPFPVAQVADRMELIWVRGNHDFDAESVAHLIRATFVPEYTFLSGGRRVLCVHGDAWDGFLTDHPIITNIADWFYLRMQALEPSPGQQCETQQQDLCPLRRSVRTEGAAVWQGQGRRGGDLRPHTFRRAPADPNAEGCIYYNTGCWTDHHCHYVTALDGRFASSKTMWTRW